MKKFLTEKRSIDSSGTITVNEDNLIEISFASPTPYLRHTDDGYTYNEILVISEDSVKWDRLTDQKCPLLLDHDMEKQIGVVEKAWIEGDKLKALVRFSESEFAQMILKDVKDGIRRNVSFGYIINDHRVEKKQGEPDNVYITNFETYEISIVSCPADPNVGYKRSLETEDIDNMKKSKKEIKEDEAMVETIQESGEEKSDKAETPEEEKVSPEVESEVEIETEPETETEPEEEEDTTDESEEIRAAGELAGEEELANECIENKKSLEDFKNMVKSKRKINSNKEKKGIKSMSKFSISKAIRNACKQYKEDVSNEFETKVIEENRRSISSLDNLNEYDVIVTESQLRALAPSGAVGGALVNTDYLPQEYTPVLRPELTLERTGYKVIPVNGNSISFTVNTSGCVASMYDLDGQLNDSDMKFTLKELKPRKAGVCVPIPYSLILQARPEIDAIVEGDIVNALAELRDQMILKGTGTDNQPSGIIANTEVNTMLPSAVFSWNGVCTAEKMIRDSNDFGPLCWVMNRNQ